MALGAKTWGERETRARDNGILVHSTGEDGGYSKTWMPGIEFQIVEGGTGDLLVVPGPEKGLSLSSRSCRARPRGKSISMCRASRSRWTPGA